MTGSYWCVLHQGDHGIVVRSPFRAKHHVVVQYMARRMKCPLPPSPFPNTLPQPPPQEQHDWWKTKRTRKN